MQHARVHVHMLVLIEYYLNIPNDMLRDRQVSFKHKFQQKFVGCNIYSYLTKPVR